MQKYLLIVSTMIILGLVIDVLLTWHNIWQVVFALVGMTLFLYGIWKEYQKMRQNSH